MGDTDQTILESLAEDVADATPVDWDALTGTPVGASGQVAALRAIAAVAAAYRESSNRLPAGTDLGATAELSAPRPPLFRWGHLEAIELLGSGAFGEVYRARDPLLDRAVALKLRRGDATWREGERSGFIREARTLARVRHSNVIVVHGADVHDGRVGLWTDLVEGHTLEEGLAFEGAMDAREAALVGIDLCAALAAVHAAGLVHGDVKASNVMRERGGRIVLMDFGAGGTIDAARSDDRAVCGTPLAMAPEVLHGERPGPAADVYALGVLLHRLVSGRYPFHTASLGELIEAQASAARVPLAELCPALPSAFVEAVERALAPSPAERWPSAVAMRRALEGSVEPGAPARAAEAGPAPLGLLAGWWSSRPAGVRRAAAGVALAVLAAAVLLGARAALRREGAATAPVRTVAVLPFQLLGAGADDAYLGLAMADALINRLSGLEEIRVRPTSAIAGLGKPGSDYRALARDLEVDVVLDGRIQRLGDRVRVSVQLTEGTSGLPVWAETFDRAATDIFALQDSVSEQASRALQVRLGDAEGTAPTARPTGNAAAYQAYLKGRFFWNKRDPRSLDRAIEQLRQAVRLDPGFALAWSGQADAWLALADLEEVHPPADLHARAREAVGKALALEPDAAGVVASLGNLRFRADWDWEGAERDLERAIQLDPRCLPAHQWKSELLSLLGRHGEAIAEAQLAEQLDPLSLPVNAGLGAALLAAGQLDAGIERLRRTLELDASFLPAYESLARAHSAKGQIDRAVRQWQNALVLAGGAADEAGSLGTAFERSGPTGAWRWRLDRLAAQEATGWPRPALRARAQAALGEPDAAFASFARAADARDPLLLAILGDPALASLKADRRFTALAVRLGLRPTAGSGRGSLRIDAALTRDLGASSEPLASGDTVWPGDRLFLAVSASEPIHLYVLNEDRAGSVFVLFPLPGVAPANPLAAGIRHRLPGQAAGVVQDWVVTSAGGEERFLIVGTRHPLPEIDREIAVLPLAAAERAVEEPPTGGDLVAALRGVGGLQPATRRSPAGETSHLDDLRAALAPLASDGDIWVHEVVLAGSVQ